MKTSQAGRIARTGKMSVSASTIYRIFAGGVILSSFLAIMIVQVVSTASGLSGGSYELTILTNSYGENYLELALEVAALPGAIYFFMSLKSVVEGGSAVKAQKGTMPVEDVPLYFGNLRWNPPRKAPTSNSTNDGSRSSKDR